MSDEIRFIEAADRSCDLHELRMIVEALCGMMEAAGHYQHGILAVAAKVCDKAIQIAAPRIIYLPAGAREGAVKVA